MALGVQGGRRQFVAGADPPLIGHVRRPFGYAVCFLAAGDGMAPLGDDADQVAVGNAQFLAVFGIHLDIARFIGQVGQEAAVAGHGTDRIVADFADCRQGQGVFGTFQLFGRRPGVVEMAFAVGRSKMSALVEILCPRIIRAVFRAGPLDAVVLDHLFIAGTGEFRAQGAHFVPNLFGIVVMHGIAHGRCHEAEDFPVRLAARLGFDELADALEAAVAGGIYGIVFAPGRSREDDIGIFAGLVEEDVLDDDQVDSRQGAADFRQVRIGLGRVFADDVIGVNPLLRVRFAQDFVRHIGQGQADVGWQGNAPGLFKFMADFIVHDVLIARILVGQDAHVTGPLDVVLAADRADAGGVMAVVAGHETQVGAGDDAFDAL